MGDCGARLPRSNPRCTGGPGSECFPPCGLRGNGRLPAKPHGGVWRLVGTGPLVGRDRGSPGRH
eukprot:8527473-Pyramimonas_sp.AAC.1